MPSSARIYSRLQVLLQDPDTGLDDIVDLVRVDAGLAAGVVRLGNSVHFRRGSPVSSVHEAINRVGLREVNRIVGVSVAAQMFTTDLALYQINGTHLWENSLATALAMAFLARAAAEDERQAYTVGLLRPVGRVALQRVFVQAGAEVAEVPPAGAGRGDESAWERGLFGTTNAEMSGALMVKWGFEGPLCGAVNQHRKAAGGNRMAALLHAACWAVESLGKGFASESTGWRAGDEILAKAGLTTDIVQECVLDTRSELNRWSGIVRGT